MASENVERARRFYSDERTELVSLMRQENLPEALEAQFGELFHHDFETAVPDNPLVSSTVGIRGFVATWREWLGAWETWNALTEDFVEAGEKVLVLIDVRARSKTDQVELPLRGANLLTFEDGRIRRVELYLDRDLARRAAGLESLP